MRFALIPAYEPDEKMLYLLKELREREFSILIIDDGSGTAYAPVFEKARKDACVITCSENQGKGRALKTGYQWLLQHQAGPFTTVVLDCDGQHRAEDALKLCEAAEQNPGTLILGSRRQATTSPVRSRFGNAATRGVYRLATGKAVYDTQTGMRACTRDLLPMLTSVDGERYEYEMNTLLECSKRSIPMQEIPIQTIYFDGNSGSHFQTLRDSWRIYRGILKFSASSMLGFVIDYALFSLFTFLSAGSALLFCNVSARVLSASVNFTVNRLLVFKDKGGFLKSAVQYAMLAAFILVCNSAILYVFSNVFGLNQYLAKLLTELILFVISWTVQSRLIFRFPHDNREKNDEKEEAPCSIKSEKAEGKPSVRRMQFF